MARPLFAHVLLRTCAVLALTVHDAHAQAAGSDATSPIAAPAASNRAAAPSVALIDQTARRGAGQQRLEEIVVTAQHRRENIQKTPITMSTVSGAEINQQGLSQIDEVLKNQPAVIVQGAAKGFLISVRGLGDDLPPQNGQAAVSTNYDGVYNFRAENAQIGFYDLDRVEVLEGPQNTLYGRNASGGVVNVNSSDPVIGLFGGYGTVEVGNYNLIRGEGAVNIPISPTLALRAAFTAINRDGYLSNGHEDDVADGARAKLLYKPNADVTALLGVEYAKIGGRGPGAADAGTFSTAPYTTTDPGEADQNFHSWKVWTKVDVAAGPGIITVLPAYQYAKGEYFGDFGGNATHDFDPRQALQTSIDARYSSRAGEPIKWDFGFYHYFSWNTQQLIAGACSFGGIFYLPPSGFSDNGNGPPGGPCITPSYRVNTIPQSGKTRTDAGYGEMTYPILPTFRVIGGLRYTRDAADYREADPAAVGPPGFPALANLDPGVVYHKQSHDHFDYRAGLEYDVAPRSMLYASVTSGHRAGGFNFNATGFGGEDLVSYEVGSKNRLFDNQVQLNGSFYYYDYKNYQLAFPGFDPILKQPGILFVNLPTARDFGFELSSQWQITGNDTLSGSVNYLNTRLTSNDPNLAASFKGSDFPHAPKWSVKTSYAHVFDTAYGSLTPRADVRYSSSQFVTPVAFSAQTPEAMQYQGSYVTEDVSLTYVSPNTRWSLNLYGKNLSNQAVKTNFFFGYFTVAPPRTYGAVLTAHF